MLQYSYILAYYLVRSPQTVIFEENQKDLEHNTELLSGEVSAIVKEKVKEKVKVIQITE